MGQAVPLDEMAKELTAANIKVLSSEKRVVPGFIIALCGAPTGIANVYEIAKDDLPRIPAGHQAVKRFQPWVYDGASIEVAQYDRSLQCEMGSPVSLDEMEKALRGADIAVQAKAKKADGIQHPQMCGASAPAQTASIAVTLTFAPASVLCSSAIAPTRSSPLTKKACLGPANFHLALLANCLKAPRSAGMKSSWEPRPLGKPEKARRLIPASWSATRKRAPSARLVGYLDVEVLDPLNDVGHGLCSLLEGRNGPPRIRSGGRTR
jgi:hypothetical protein